MEKYLYIKPLSLPKELCEQIISEFCSDNLNDMRYIGVMAKGVDTEYKDTTDLNITHLKMVPFWKNLMVLLNHEIELNIQTYLQQLNISSPHEWKILTIPVFQLQKYKSNQGKYHNHQDSIATKYTQRIITFLWYLNDVTEGGETTFWNDHVKIKPVAGNLLLFPAHVSFDHCGKMPISNDKYILTGWIYESINLVPVQTDLSDTL